MDKTSICRAGLGILLVACLLIAGCTTPYTPPATQTITPTGTGPRHTAGDIVRNPVAAASPVWLIIGYDAASDTYERAVIFPNADGRLGIPVRIPGLKKPPDR